MLIKRDDARKHQNSPNCTIWEHEHSSLLVSYAEAKIEGRYPEKGRGLNAVCETIFTGLTGEGVIHTDEGDFPMRARDSCYIPRGEAYWIEGDLELGVINSPAWTLEQYRVVD